MLEEEPVIPQSDPAPFTPAKSSRMFGTKTKAIFLVGLILGAGLIAAAWYLWPKTLLVPSTPTPTSTSSSSAAVPAVTNCTTGDLGMSIGSTEGTAGTVYQHIVFANKGSKTCTIAGYPTVFLLDGSSNVLGSGAVPTTVSPGTTISLAPGAKSHLAVGFPQAGNFPTGTCTANSVTIRVFLPGTASYLDAPLAKPYCPGFSTTAIISGE
jgi:hypothetical protein